MKKLGGFYEKFFKKTPFRKGCEKELKIRRIYEVESVSIKPIYKVKSYNLNVDNKQRIVLETDCKIV